jgi:hypothetical protein
MMRARLASLTLPVVCLAMLAGTALATGGQARSGAGVRRSEAASLEHGGSVSLAAAPDDLAVAELSFRHAARGQAVSTRSLQLAVRGPFGADYLVAGVARVGTGDVPRVLVLLVNRPSALLDPVAVRLRFSAGPGLGAPVLSTFADPFTRPPSGSSPALCDLALHGSALGAAAVAPLFSRGQQLAGFSGPAAIAQAYDVACGLPSTGSFAQAIGRPQPQPQPAPAPVPVPSPSPSPPAPGPPGCVPCDPAPGYACPLALHTDICAAEDTSGARPSATGAH